MQVLIARQRTASRWLIIKANRRKLNNARGQVSAALAASPIAMLWAEWFNIRASVYGGLGSIPWNLLLQLCCSRYLCKSIFRWSKCSMSHMRWNKKLAGEINNSFLSHVLAESVVYTFIYRLLFLTGLSRWLHFYRSTSITWPKSRDLIGRLITCVCEDTSRQYISRRCN